jgi:hypothetical protein
MNHFLFLLLSIKTLKMTTKVIQSSAINIGLFEKTRIMTDQGIVIIKNIIPLYHTIDNKQIVALIQNVVKDKFLVHFSKHSLSRNYPNKSIVISCHHKIKYRGMYIESCKFVGLFPNVKYITYNGEPLYNILMDNHSKISVNNIMCETLDPINPIAKLYSSAFCDDIKEQILALLNNSIDGYEYITYQKLISQLG